MFFAHVMLPDEPLQLPRLLGILLALGGVTLICGRLLGFNSPLAFWGGVAVVVWSGERGLRQRVSQGALDPVAPDMLAAWSSISIKSTSRRSNRRLNSVAWRRSAGMKSYDRSHSRQRSNLLRLLHNELNLGEVLILLEKTFFDLGFQLRCDGDFEVLAGRVGALAEGIGDRLRVAAQRLSVSSQDFDLKCPSALRAQVDYEAIRQVRDLAFDDLHLLIVRGSTRWRQLLSFISRSRILFPARLYP